MSERSRELPHAEGAPAPAAAPVDAGRLGVYAAIGATVGTVPLPWVPAALARRVRGALVHDIAVRHGRSLSPEAREALARPSSPDSEAGPVVRALRFAGLRLALRALARAGPLRRLWPLGQALQVYALGSLLDRYFRTTDGAGTRIELDEALRVRHAIDGAMARILDTPFVPALATPGGDDARDRATMLIDGLLGAAAGLPGRLAAQLEAAFDEILAGAP